MAHCKNLCLCCITLCEKQHKHIQENEEYAIVFQNSLRWIFAAWNSNGFSKFRPSSGCSAHSSRGPPCPLSLFHSEVKVLTLSGSHQHCQPHLFESFGCCTLLTFFCKVLRNPQKLQTQTIQPLFHNWQSKTSLPVAHCFAADDHSDVRKEREGLIPGFLLSVWSWGTVVAWSSTPRPKERHGSKIWLFHSFCPPPPLTLPPWSCTSSPAVCPGQTSTKASVHPSFPPPAQLSLSPTDRHSYPPGRFLSAGLPQQRCSVMWNLIFSPPKPDPWPLQSSHSQRGREAGAGKGGFWEKVKFPKTLLCMHVCVWELMRVCMHLVCLCSRTSMCIWFCEFIQIRMRWNFSVGMYAGA